MDVSPTVDVHLASADRRAALERDVRTGMAATPKQLSPVWFYDDRGSELFDEITRLPEYYLTAAEREILERHAHDIVQTAKADTLVELGSGTSEKTRLLLDAMQDTGCLQRFVPLDVSEETLRGAAASIGAEYPGTQVRAVVGDLHHHLDQVPRDGRRLVAFLGSTIGNLTPERRRRFLVDLDASMRFDEHVLVGTDLVKDHSVLLAAYDDAAGVTAEFNRNLLRVLNRELGADFDPDAFEHVARWDAAEHWIEMRLRARSPQRVRFAALELEVSFAAGEEMRTEISAKFTPERVRAELWDAGFVTDQQWSDGARRFMLTLAHPLC